MTKIHHHGVAWLGFALLAAAVVAAAVSFRRRTPNSPQWPLLALAAGMGLNGLSLLGVWRGPCSVASYLTVWFSIGAAGTQLLDEATRPQAARRLR
ncbi:MAG: hypothetical protein ACLQVD_09645 [Capsulimonadaceae bacterium]